MSEVEETGSTWSRRNCRVALCSELAHGPLMESYLPGTRTLPACKDTGAPRGSSSPSPRAAGVLPRWVAVLWASHICLWHASVQAVISVNGCVLLSWAAQLLIAKKLVSQDPEWAPERVSGTIGQMDLLLLAGLWAQSKPTLTAVGETAVGS